MSLFFNTVYYVLKLVLNCTYAPNLLYWISYSKINDCLDARKPFYPYITLFKVDS